MLGCMFSVYPFPMWWLRGYIYILSYYHHQIGSMNYYPLFRVRSWNNGVRCMSFYILTMIAVIKAWVQLLNITENLVVCALWLNLVDNNVTTQTEMFDVMYLWLNPGTDNISRLSFAVHSAALQHKSIRLIRNDLVMKQIIVKGLIKLESIIHWGSSKANHNLSFSHTTQSAVFIKFSWMQFSSWHPLLLYMGQLPLG